MEFGLVVLWLSMLLLLGLIALPIAAFLFPDLESGAFAFPLALSVLAVVGHLVGQLAFGWPAVLGGLGMLALGAVMAIDRVDVELRSFLEAGVVFTMGFLLIVAIRAVNPAAAPLPLAIGEKFLDYGLLTTLARTGTLPPEDVWFAGKPVRYYYGGHLTTALLATLTGTAPRFAYNLGLATFFGTLVAAAYGLSGSIVAEHGISHRWAGGLGAFFVGIAGNLETPARVVVWLLPDGVARSLAAGMGLDPAVAMWTPADFHYFDASRVIPVDPGVPDPFYAATEFPLFAWLNGDLHAHMMSQPFMLLAVALLIAYWRTGPGQSRRRQLLLFGALPPVAGLIGFVNLWSFPTVGGLVMLAVVFAPTDPADLIPGASPDWLDTGSTWLTEELRRVGLGVVTAVAVLVLGIAWTLPFWIGGLPGTSQAALAIWWVPTPLGGLLLVHGAFLAAFVPYLSRRIHPTVGPRWGWALGLLAFAGITVWAGVPALGLFVPILVAAWWVLRSRTDGGAETLLVLGGVGIVLIVEFVTVEGERFNTIFKPYVHVWLFWGVAAGVVLPRLVTRAGGSASSTTTALARSRKRIRTTGGVLALAILVSTGLYAGLALPAHFAEGSSVADIEGPTLDATAYVTVHYPEEAEAIAWLDGRTGQPTLVTAAPGHYWWRPDEGQGASAPATLTGVPTVLGWFHERQYRGSEPYQRRLADVETIYEGTPAERGPLLDQYDVAYVYVGEAERVRYDVTVDSDPALEPVYPDEGSGPVVIYRVARDRSRS